MNRSLAEPRESVTSGMGLVYRIYLYNGKNKRLKQWLSEATQKTCSRHIFWFLNVKDF